MPFNQPAMTRRRHLLGMTQNDLAITAGISQSTVHNIETHRIPADGGNVSIDVLMRIAMALRMEWHELMIAPTGNRYERAARFAKEQHDVSANPKLHDRTRTVRADAYRRLTGTHAARDVMGLVDREEEDATDPVLPPVVGDETGALPSYEWEQDPSTE